MSGSGTHDDVFVFVFRTCCAARCLMEGDDGPSEGLWIDLLGDLVPEVSLPLGVVQKIADRKGDVCVVVLFVLLEDDIPPRGVQIPTCHVARES